MNGYIQYKLRYVDKIWCGLHLCFSCIGTEYIRQDYLWNASVFDFGLSVWGSHFDETVETLPWYVFFFFLLPEINLHAFSGTLLLCDKQGISETVCWRTILPLFSYFFSETCCCDSGRNFNTTAVLNSYSTHKHNILTHNVVHDLTKTAHFLPWHRLSGHDPTEIQLFKRWAHCWVSAPC